MARLAVVAVMACTALLHGDELTRKLAARLPEEAAAFAREAVKVVGTETLRQHALLSVTRDSTGHVTAKYQDRVIVSQYSFVSFRETPDSLRELRQVETIDGKPAKTRSLDSVAAAVTAGDERQKRKVLEDFEKLGLKGVATELGQLILLFNARKIRNYDFSLQAQRYVGTDRVMVFSYSQTEGAGSMTVYRDKDVVRPKLSGEVWVDRNLRPFKVTLASVVETPDMKGQVRHEMEVYYASTAAGNLLPVRARYREIRNGGIDSVTDYEYRNFRPWEDVKK